MSFGFGISDFVTLTTLAARVVGKYRNAPDEYQALKTEVSKLNNALLDVTQVLERLGSDHKCYMDESRENCEELLVEIEKFLDKHEAMKSSKMTVAERVKWMTSKQREYVTKVKMHNDELHKAWVRLTGIVAIEIHHHLSRSNQHVSTSQSAYLAIEVRPIPDSGHQLPTKPQQQPPSKKTPSGDDPSRRATEPTPKKKQYPEPSADSSPSFPASPNWGLADPKQNFGRHRADTQTTLVDDLPPQSLAQSPTHDDSISTSSSMTPTSRSPTNSSTSPYPHRPRKPSSAASTKSSSGKSSSGKTSFLKGFTENFGQSASLGTGFSSAADNRPPPPERERKRPSATPPTGRPPLKKEQKKSWKESMKLSKNLGSSSPALGEL